MRRAALLLAVCALLLAGAWAANLAENWRTIVALTANSDVRVLSGSEFLEQVVRSPRNYTVVLLFTAPDCEPCKRLEVAQRELAQRYFAALRSTPTLPRLFFFSLNAFANQQIVKKMDLIVPSVLHVPPTEKKFPHSHDQLFLLTSVEQASVEPLATWLHEKTGVALMQPPQPTWLALALPVALLLFYFRQTLLAEVRSKWFWFMITLGVYMLTMSGLYVPQMLLARDPNSGLVRLVHPQIRAQFRIEGVLAAFCMVVAGMCWVSLVGLIPQVEGATNKRLVLLFYGALALVAANIVTHMFCIKQNYPFCRFIRWPIPFLY